MRQYSIERILVGRIPTGADLLQSIQRLCERHEVQAGHLSLMGALERSHLGWYDPRAGDYRTFTVDELAEILYVTGNISLKDGRPFPHVHAVLGLRDEKTFGGHVLEGCRVYVAEYQITVYRGEPLSRVHDPQTGLKLWRSEE